mgnify:FL=1
MEPDHGDKAPEQVEDAAFALREQAQPRMVVITAGDFPIGTIVLRATRIPLALE